MLLDPTIIPAISRGRSARYPPCLGWKVPWSAGALKQADSSIQGGACPVGPPVRCQRGGGRVNDAGGRRKGTRGWFQFGRGELG